METYCLRCEENTTIKSSNVGRTKHSKLVIIVNCAICGKKKSRFIKNQEASGLLHNLWIRTSLSKIPLIGDALF